MGEIDKRQALVVHEVVVNVVKEKPPVRRVAVSGIRTISAAIRSKDVTRSESCSSSVADASGRSLWPMMSTIHR